MWYFAIPLFLLELDPTSLFLTAAYGLTLAISVLLFAPLVGDWIDRKPRMYTITVCLLTQNLSVAISAVILILHREFGRSEDESNTIFTLLVQISAIFFGAVAKLASTGCQIMIQRDWIVVVASGKAAYLADLNAMVRRIDLVTKILSPLACGQIMTLTSLTGGAIFIVVWNILSMCSEYYLLRVVYKRTPALATKRSDDDEEGEEMANLNENGKTLGSAENASEHKTTKRGKKKTKQKKPLHRKMFGFIFVILEGWELYMKQTITFVGVGMACLYLTVLNFGYVMTSYAYNQCFSEFFVGILLGAAAVAGIGGTFIFPVLRTRVGLVKTGLFCGWFQVATVIPCVASLWVTGSPFFLYPGSHYQPQDVTSKNLYETIAATVIPTVSPATENGVLLNTTKIEVNMTGTSMPAIEHTTQTYDHGLVPRILFKCLEGISPPPSFLSLLMLLSGILLARAGLWGFDLTVTQLIQENVAEKERGVVNGVQQSLSMSMDMIGYILVLFLPKPHHFGILILVSAAAVFVGHTLYGLFAHRAGVKFDQGGALAVTKAEKVEDEQDAVE